MALVRRIARSVKWFATAAGAVALLAPLSAAALQSAMPDEWALALRDSLRWEGASVRLADIVSRQLPAAVEPIVVAAAQPRGGVAVVDRRHVMRCLIEAGLARGVRLEGALACRISFGAEAPPPPALAERLKPMLAGWLPTAIAGAPASWLDLSVPAPALPGRDSCAVSLVDPEPLRPGRNLVKVRVARGGRSALVTASVNCHVYRETARALGAIPSDSPLGPEQFLWEWRDMAHGAQGLVVGRESVVGVSAGRALTVGQQLRQADLKTTPLVRQGDAIDLTLDRGGVAVTVRATARQDGVLHQIITVRNEVTGQLVTARVAATGRVTWRR